MAGTEPTPATGTKTYRLVTLGLGLLFVATAIAIVVLSELTVGPVVAALILGILGIDALLSAYQGRRSLVSRIGPLP